MSWAESVYRYCERGQDPSFWAEPFNAVSNVAMLVVAGVAWVRLEREPRSAPGSGGVRLLIALTLAIGVGSFLYHTIATRWSRLADVIPIVVFMVVYQAFALRTFLGWSWSKLAVGVGVFLAASGIAASISCPAQVKDVVTFAREPCLKGTMGYVPAVVALLLVGGLLQARHPAGTALLTAGGVFLVAMLVRWLDARSCAWSSVLGSPRGTHALWHVLVALTLHILLGAAIAAVWHTPRDHSVAVTPPST